MSTQYTGGGFHNWVAGVKARWWSDWGFGTTPNVRYAASNNFLEKAVTAARTNDKPVWRVDTDNALRIGEEAITPMAATVNFSLATNASIVTQHFFIAPIAMEITDIQCIFATADGAANTGYITHETGTQAPGTGATVMNGTFNLNATAATSQAATLWVEFPSAVGSTQTAKYASVIRMAAGDRLSFVIASAVTSLAGLQISIAATPGGKGVMAVYNMQANGDLVDQTFFVANRDFIVSAAYEVHSTLGTNGSAVNVQVVKDTSTNAPGAGTDLLTNSTNAGFNLKSAINTVTTGTLTATAASLRLAPGDRLAVDYAGTLTAVAGVVVVVLLEPIQARKEVTYTLSKNANLVDQYFFEADRPYEILAISEVHSVLGTNGSAVSLQVTRDKTTDAPGAGTDLLSNNTAAGFDMKATVNTVQLGTFTDTRFNFLLRGDRLSVDYAGTLTSLAGVTVTVSLRPC